MIGPRAYETDSALVENNRRSAELRPARRSWSSLQYQQQRFFNGGFAPFPMKVGGPPLPPPGSAPGTGILPFDPAGGPRPGLRRIERAPAPPPGPGSSTVPGIRTVLVSPTGKGGSRSGDSTSREVGIRHYRPVLETHDPGEAPLSGGLCGRGTVGKGTYVYTGLSFFRQLPAWVPGAFRLFANLLALRGR